MAAFTEPVVPNVVNTTHQCLFASHRKAKEPASHGPMKSRGAFGICTLRFGRLIKRNCSGTVASSGWEATLILTVNCAFAFQVCNRSTQPINDHLTDLSHITGAIK